MSPHAFRADHEVRRFLICRGEGTIDFGWITGAMAAAIGLQPGPIRLQQGISGPKGSGNLHVEAYPARMKQLGNLGFQSFADFISRVAKGFSRITEAGVVNRVGLVMPFQGYDLQLIVQNDAEGFGGVTTGLPYRVARGRVLHTIARTGRSETTRRLSGAPRFATLSLPKIGSGGNGI
jgi:hypothetical protein